MLNDPSYQSVLILAYHSISVDAQAGFKRFALPPALFAEHMSLLHERRCMPMTVTELVTQRAKGFVTSRDTPIVLTFDDGYLDFYTDGLPILQRYGFAATLFVTTAYVGDKSRWLKKERETDRRMLDWPQLKEISAGGIEIGSHSHTHPELDQLSLSAAREEIVRSRSILEQELKAQVTSFAYPFGYYNSAVQQIVRDSGYLAACSVRHEMSSTRDDLFALGRIIVEPNMDTESLASLLATHKPPLNVTFNQLRSRIWRLLRQARSRPSTEATGGTS